MEEIHNTIYKIHVANTINRPLCYQKFKMIDMDPQEVKDIDVTKCFQWVFKKYSNTDIGNNRINVVSKSYPIIKNITVPNKSKPTPKMD